MLMLLGEAIGSGEILTEPVAGARYGGALLWVILFTVVTKAFWNEAIGRVALATGQNFLEACSGMGPPISWVPWVWLVINALKDFLLRGGIVAIGGLICYDVFGDLPGWMVPGSAPLGHCSPRSRTECELDISEFCPGMGHPGRGRLSPGGVVQHGILPALHRCAGGMCCFIFPEVTGELASGLVPRMATSPDQLLVMMSLAGIVMAGSGTIKYSAWAEERDMGLFAHTRDTGRLSRDQFQPVSEEEIKRMRGWLRVSRINISLSYGLGMLICLATFVLGVGILRPAGVQLAPK